MCEIIQRVYIGIGSNLLNPRKQVEKAIISLSKIPKTEFLAHSSYYRSKPLYILNNQPDFLNVVVVLDTFLSAEKLLSYMQIIENQQGRLRGKNIFRWSSRTLDLDILLFGSYVINTTRLIIPHYDIMERDFFIYPLFELNSSLVFPNGKIIKNVVETFSKKNNLNFWE